MITQIISAQITKNLFKTFNTYKSYFWEKFLKPKTKFQLHMTFFHITIEASEFFSLPIPLDMCFYMERTVNRANTDYVLCQYVILHNLRSAIQHYYQGQGK